jgi:hypothetical protein
MQVGNEWQYEWANWTSNPPLHMDYENIQIISDTVMSNGLTYYVFQRTRPYPGTASLQFMRLDSANRNVVFLIDSSNESIRYFLTPQAGIKPDTFFGVPTTAMTTGPLDHTYSFTYAFGLISELNYVTGWPYRSTLKFARVKGKEFGIPVSVLNNVNRPPQFVLHQNYPNPFNPSTTIRFTLAQMSYVTLKVFNLLGQEMKTLSTGYRVAGNHKVKFDAQGLPSGIYVYRLQAEGYIISKPMILVK